MRVLITGVGGQLGRVLVKTAPPDAVLIGRDRELDITDPEQVDSAITSLRPDLVINAAAYTAVDQAETERDQAFAINARGPELLARCCRAQGARLLQMSTDYVFDGLQSRPYAVADPRHPLGVYGASKSEGEDRVTAVMGSNTLIIRTGWLYAAHGRNFVTTMLRLMAQENELRVIADQVGTPTWAVPLAHLIWTMASQTELRGVFHWSDAGVASWYDFALAIQEEALVRGLLAKAIPIKPISTEDYVLSARRPAYGVLDKRETIVKTGCTPVHWRANLRTMLGALADG